MIGKMQDMVTAAVVVSAAENRGTKFSSNVQGNAQTDNEAVAIKSASQPNVNEAITATQGSENMNSKEQEKQNQDNKLSNAFVSEMTKELNALMSKLSCDLEFQYHKEVDVMSVRMVDKKTKEVIKEYPPEEMVEGMIKAQEWLGAFLDKNA